MSTNSSLNMVMVILLFLVSCGGEKNKPSGSVSREDTEFKYTTRISMISHPENWKEVKIINPWDTTQFLEVIAMVPSSMDTLPANIPEGATVLRTPLNKSLVQSTVHVGLLEEFGALDAIAGVSDPAFIKSEEIQKRLAEGKVENCGGWMSPDLEKIIRLKPDAILISPYQNGGNYGLITELGIPIVFVADYMETDPLGRAEWIKFYGELFGKAEKADSIFAAVEHTYNKIKRESLEASKLGKKRILFDTPHSGSWYVPATGSTNDVYIRDAGGINPFSYISKNQFSSLSPEKVLAEANDADVWIIRLNSSAPLSLELLKQDIPFAGRFKAYSTGNVWGCNTNESLYYEETPFHPEKVLEDIYHILYDSNPSDSLNFFNRLQ